MIIRITWRCESCQALGSCSFMFPTGLQFMHDTIYQSHRKLCHQNHRACGGTLLLDIPKALPELPELAKAVPVVLYFDNDRNAEEFISMVHAAKPGLTIKQL